MSRDLKSPNYGKMEVYAVRNGSETLRVHASRCLEIKGKKVPSSASGIAEENRYWGMSMVPPIWEYLRDFIGAMGSVSDILYEFIVGKYKLSDLDIVLAQGNEGLLQNRIEAIEMSKSLLHAVLLGIEEDYSRDAASLVGVPESIDRFMMVLSAVTGIPVARLFGRSAAGLNATGENDLRNYYDSVKSKQRSQLSSIVQRLVHLLSVWRNVEEPRVVWNPLMQMSEKEKADKERVNSTSYRTTADGDSKYIEQGVLLPEDIRKLRFPELSETEENQVQRSQGEEDDTTR